jgi:hypothetical protein
MDETITPVSANALTITWRTLMDVARNYELGSPGEAHLIDARRLIEIEMRTQHGDDAWTALRD